MKKTILIIWACIALFTIPACKKTSKQQSEDKGITNPQKSYRLLFDADSAYSFVQKQVSFGPRVPGSTAHGITADYLLNKLRYYCDDAMIQEGEIAGAEGKLIPLKNIIGSFNPQAKKRILLCAHWDTRPHADQDPENSDQPADGANDGASGVGVLLEVARQLKEQKPNIGLDIIFFDAEDMGESQAGMESWCLGSQYWSRNPHKENYRANYAILLDMVGAKNAQFAQELHSLNYAKNIVNKVWDAGQSLGYGKHFINYKGSAITDDHYFINTIIGIPAIDIIQYDISTGTGFGEYWHTHDDNMKVIDQKTLKAVGETVLKVVMDED